MTKKKEIDPLTKIANGAARRIVQHIQDRTGCDLSLQTCMEITGIVAEAISKSRQCETTIHVDMDGSNQSSGILLVGEEVFPDAIRRRLHKKR